MSNELKPQDFLYQTTESPFGTPYKKWTELWLNWLAGIPIQTNPARDPSGQYGNQNQPGKDVWYLAGEVKGKAKRKIRIPERRAILCPVVNYEWSEFEIPRFEGKADELREFTQDFLDDMYSLDAIIDEGEDEELKLYTGTLCKYRVSSDFDITFSADNIFNTHTGLTKASGDGYWIFIRENVFKKGEQHTILLRGITQYYQTEVTYEITIV
jgi:hypothetical protein